MVDITNINIIVLGIFSHKTKTVIIKLYLLTFMIMLLNYIKENPKSSKNLSAKIITNDIVANQNYNNSIHLKIFKSFLYSPFYHYFNQLSNQIFQRQKLKLKNIFYKNYYLIELNNNNIIFCFQPLFSDNTHNYNGGYKYQIKIHKKEQIWSEILYHCHILKNNYMNQYSLNFKEENYENFYAIFELKSTFPRRKFIIKFLPILNGLALIHEFVQTKLSSLEGNENSHYKEYESTYGYFNEINTLSQKTSNTTQSRLFFQNEVVFKKINNFFVGSLSLKNQNKGLFYSRKLNNIYINEDIMRIINNYKQEENIFHNNSLIIKNIENELYEDYLQEIIYNNELKKSKNNNIIFYNNEDTLHEEKVDLNITKKYILNILFNNEKNISKASKKTLSLKDISLHSKFFSGSRKDFTKFSDMLNDNISEYRSSIYNSNNKILKESNNNLNNSIKLSNALNSTNNILNQENSVIKDNSLFNINISNIQKNKNNNYKKKDDEESKITDLDMEFMDSKEEFFKGEIKNKIK